MTNEELENGNKLSIAINKANKELEAWERSTSYRTSEIFLNDGTNYNKANVEDVIDFDELKNIAIGRLKQKLQLLKDDFSKL